MTPMFSIVIPTVDRLETLKSTIATLTSQEYGDAEFLISENACTDGTAEYVQNLSDTRVRLLRTNRRVSMAENWSFAISQATGKYLAVVGDDDGLVPGALREAAALFTKHEIDCLSWITTQYWWPSYADETYANQIGFSAFSGLYEVRSKDALRAFRLGILPYFLMTCPYSGLVKREILEHHRNETGAYIHSEIPDVYLSLAVASKIDKYVLSMRSFSISGAASKSVGAGLRDDRKANATLSSFTSGHRIGPHHLFPTYAIPSVQAYIFEAALRARDHAFNGKLSIPRLLWFAIILRQLTIYDSDKYAAAVSDLCKVARLHHAEWFVKWLAKRLHPQRAVEKPGARRHFAMHTWTDAKKFGVQTVLDAGALVEKITPLAGIGDTPQIPRLAPRRMFMFLLADRLLSGI